MYAYPHAGLTAPYSVTARIKKDTIIVTWKHTVKDEPIHGYYISVQEVSKDLKLGAPDFVHVKKDVRTVAIRGAKPKAVYEMKVRKGIRMYFKSLCTISTGYCIFRQGT